MVGVAQLVRAPDCGSGCRGFESHLPPQTRGDRGHPGPLFSFPLGRRQVVRQGTLTPSSAGSSPAVPARPFRRPRGGCHRIGYDPLAQQAEQLPFKQWVRGSNPRRVTTSSRTVYRSRRLFLQTSSLTHSAAPPFKTEPAALGFGLALPANLKRRHL